MKNVMKMLVVALLFATVNSIEAGLLDRLKSKWNNMRSKRIGATHVAAPGRVSNPVPGSTDNRVHPADAFAGGALSKPLVNPRTVAREAAAAEEEYAKMSGGAGAGALSTPGAHGASDLRAEAYKVGPVVLSPEQEARLAEFKRVTALRNDAIKLMKRAQERGESEGVGMLKAQALDHERRRTALIPESAELTTLRTNEAALNHRGDSLDAEIQAHHAAATEHVRTGKKDAARSELRLKNLKTHEKERNDVQRANARKARAGLEKALVISGGAAHK